MAVYVTFLPRVNEMSATENNCNEKGTATKENHVNLKTCQSVFKGFFCFGSIFVAKFKE